MPVGLAATEAVVVVLNYFTAYQMLNRPAKARPGQSMLIHGPSPTLRASREQNPAYKILRCVK